MKQCECGCGKLCNRRFVNGHTLRNTLISRNKSKIPQLKHRIDILEGNISWLVGYIETRCNKKISFDIEGKIIQVNDSINVE